MQEVYCFILPFILKWLVAALVASVLVSLFSRLRRQGDHSSTTIYAQIRALFDEWLQCVRHHVSSNKRTLLILVRLIGRDRVSGRVSKAMRYAGNDYRIVHNDQYWHYSHMCLAFWASQRTCFSTMLRQGFIVLYLTTLTLSYLCLKSFMWTYAFHTFKLVRGCACTGLLVSVPEHELPGLLWYHAHALCSFLGCYIHQQLYRSDPCLLPFTRQSTLHAVQIQACMHVCMDFV